MVRSTNVACECTQIHSPTKLVVLTGGPGAGKTAILEIARRHFCEHVTVLPESAGIVYGGGFPRRVTIPARKAAQRAIFHVQRELEALAHEEGNFATALCDRGTLDGLAYWPGEQAEALAEFGTTLKREQARYHAVIHLRTPAAHRGYNHRNPLRIESAEEAEKIDEKIATAWEGHPNVFVVDSSRAFLEKAAHAIALIQAQISPCCRQTLTD